MSKLTNKQEMFCKEYIIDLNATQAAIRAGYSEKTAGVQGFENLKKPYIQEYIQGLMHKRAKKAEISSETVLNGILDVIYRNKEKDDKTVLKGYELLGKHLKLFTDKVEHSGSVENKVIIKIGNDDDWTTNWS